MLEIINLNKSFNGFKVLKDINVFVEKGEILGFIGPNGAGKTTLYNIITKSIEPTSGILKFMNKNITKFKPHEVNHLGISRTFQVVRPFRSLCVYENILVSSFHGKNNSSNFKECIKRTLETINFLGLEEYMNVVTDNLPAPKLRSLEIARAIVQNPDLLLLDEALAGLNPKEKEEVLEKIRILNGKGMTIIIVEHDMNAIMNISKRIIVLNDGKIIASGKPEEIRNDKNVIKVYLGEEYAEGQQY